MQGGAVGRRWCDGKRRYLTGTSALAAIRRQQAGTRRFTAPKEDHPLSAYPCRTCGFWHVGHHRYRRAEWGLRSGQPAG